MRLALVFLFAFTTAQPVFAGVPEFLRKHCIGCHSGDEPSADVRLDGLKLDFDREAELWERVVRKLQSRQMPPPTEDRPNEAEYAEVLKEVTSRLDEIAAKNPNPGRVPSLRRLTRVEYQNAIRDLLHIDVDASKLLPKDESSHGFDNITVGELSPTLLNRYITAAQRISRLAMGSEIGSPTGDTFRLKGDLTQENHVDGLPFGTRGGTLINYTFPRDGRYEIQARLMRDRNEEIEGLYRKHEVVFLIDRKQVKSFTVDRPKDKNYSLADAHLKAMIDVKAGPHRVGVTFVKDGSSLIEEKRQPYDARFNMHRHRRTAPALFQVSITGPFESTGSGDTPSRRRIFEGISRGDESEAAAKKVLQSLVRRAYRRPVKDADLEKPMAYFNQVREDKGSFDDAIQLALTSVLISPQFLFKIERQTNLDESLGWRDGPDDKRSEAALPRSDLELASRLSFFLWSSIPDDELLSLAEENKLSEPKTLERQVRRMLADSKASSLTTNFAGQWLYLRNLDSITPDLRQFPDFDDNLRQSFRRETELFFESIHREDRSVLDLLSADYTFLDERLARHYGIPHVTGSRFRRVKLDREATHRGGLLRHGSILTVTSYATRTSPVIRGHWILKNLLGSPPPPPPADVPDLKDNTVDASLSVRERLAEHRSNEACASCHRIMDPIGFALENFDAVGRWRDFELGQPVDATGGLAGFDNFTGVDGLEAAVAANPELFVRTLVEKLMTYALGRGIEHHDAPAIREILRRTKPRGYRFSDIVVEVTNSVPFRYRSNQVSEPRSNRP